MNMLMWLSHSERPLKANELRHALGVESESTDLDPQNIPSIETLLGCALGLVSVEASSYVVRLVHYTLQEYLSDNTSLFHSPHAMIAEVCLTYLNFQCIRNLSPTLHLSPPATHFLEYASCYWGTHARREITESVNTLALRLLDGFDKHVSSVILLSSSRDNWHWTFSPSDPTGFTGFHCAAYLEIVQTAIALLKVKKWDLDATDVAGNTAVSWASRKEAIVRTVLEHKGITLITADKGGRTPPFWPAENQHRDTVQQFLEWVDVTPDNGGKDGRTPLSWAAGNGDECIVKRLLERGSVAPNTVDDHGRTPLSWAAGSGHKHTVEVLLEREDVTPDTADKGGRTPLSWAARNGQWDIAEMLLRRKDVTPNTAGEDGRTPLSRAAGNGREDIVEMLLRRKDVTPDTADKDGRTPLSWAAGNGQGDIVEMLLKREDVTPDTADKDGRTPLSWTARNGHGCIAGVLLLREDVTPNTLDIEGRTPLSWAAGNGHGDIVQILLEWGDAAPGTADEGGRTPLSWAAGNGHRYIVKMLLEQEDAAPDTRDKEVQTPLSWPAANKNEDMAETHLEQEGVTPDTADQSGRIGVVETLLERRLPGEDMAMTDLVGHTPLLQASEKQRVGVLKRKLGDQGSAPHSVDSNSPIDLFIAEPSELSHRPSKRIQRS